MGPNLNRSGRGLSRAQALMSSRHSLGEGDVVKTEADGIGTLVNPVALEDPKQA